MKLIQFFLPGKGKRVGLVQGDRVLDVTSGEEGVRSTLDLVTQGKTTEGVVTRASWLARRLHQKGLDWRELQRPPSRRSPHLLVPIDAPEVWGVRDAYLSRPETVSGARVSAAPRARPALFFKATAHRIAGPQAPIAIRRDSVLTAPEAGLAVVLGSGGRAVGFTACNDVTARDIEQSAPEYLSQARIYFGSCALGPCVITSDEVEDPCALQVRCSILRAGKAIFSEATNTAHLRWPVEELVGWLRQDDSLPLGAVLSTGTGIVVPDGMALSDGDQVEIEVQSIGRLSNPVRRL
jgi:2-dehydro-3-deoxy-D-arabinonate dehydratase